uniref:Presenilin n=1 Tax=Henneguya salminicola TaxID=69463 RepID=A0A6G3MEX8_HENSL
MLTQILDHFNLSMDYFTLVFILVNYSVVGMIAIFTSLSLKIQQFYHIISSALIACLLIRVFPEWTGWVVLIVLVVWDLIAVLTPFGPLKLLVDMASERGESLFPALIFKTMIEPDPNLAPLIELGSSSESRVESIPPLSYPSAEQELNLNTEDDSDETSTYPGSQLGLGDFASLYEDMNVIFCCYVAVVFGFLITFLILICLGRALPALPVSLILGLIVYFSSAYLVSPFFSFISENRLII